MLRLLRRRSLARLRREVEPVDPAALGRFLPAWQGVVPASGPGPTRRRSAAARRWSAWPRSSTSSRACRFPASVLERDVLPARVPGYQPRLLDELGALGEVAWVGRGSLGRDDGRVVLYRPGREALRPAAPSDADDAGGATRQPAPRGASASTSRRAAPRSIASHPCRGAAAGSEREVLDALWDLVWAGEVTNDTFAPLRALRWKRPARLAGPARDAGARAG